MDLFTENSLNPLFGGPLRILVVDDDFASLETLEVLLLGDGHEIFTASRGGEALEVVRQLKRERVRLDLSILDYHMPDQTGIDTYIEMTAELPDLEAVFVTGEVSKSVQESVFTAGGRALVPKPVNVGRMRSVLSEFMRDRRRL